MVRATLNPSLLAASCCSVLVVKGGLGDRGTVLLDTLCTCRQASRGQMGGKWEASEAGERQQDSGGRLGHDAMGQESSGKPELTEESNGAGCGTASGSTAARQSA